MRVATPVLHPALTPLRTGSPLHAPLLLFPGAGASLFCFGPLLQELHMPGMIWGLDGCDAQQAVEQHAQAMACTWNPAAPPAHLLGHSFGAWHAFALACALCEAGQPPLSLTLLDAAPPSPLGILNRDLDEIEQWQRLARTICQGRGEQISLTRAELESVPAQRRHLLLHSRLCAAGILSPASPSALLHGVAERYFNCVSTSYLPTRPYSGKARLVRAAESVLSDAEDGLDPVAGWSRYCGSLEVLTVPGNHVSMLNPPNLSQIVQLLAGLPRVESVNA